MLSVHMNFFAAYLTVLSTDTIKIVLGTAHTGVDHYIDNTQFLTLTLCDHNLHVKQTPFFSICLSQNNFFFFFYKHQNPLRKSSGVYCTSYRFDQPSGCSMLHCYFALFANIRLLILYCVGFQALFWLHPLFQSAASQHHFPGV